MIFDKVINQPIFIVGHARGGSTLLGAIVNAHSQVGPKYLKASEFDIDSFKNYKKHIEYSEKLEQKDIWFKYFKGKECFTHMGKEILEDSLKLNEEMVNNLINELTANFHEERFLSKAPTNTFRIKPIISIFPNCKILVVLRNGEEVVASWGNRPYGFGKKIDWGNIKIKKLGYFNGINIFVRKWLDVIDVVSEVSDLKNLKIVSYENLVNDTKNSLDKIFSFLELPHESYLNSINLTKEQGKWKENIPFLFRKYLLIRVYLGNKKIKKLEQNNKYN